MSKLDPKFQAKVQDLVESGLSAEQIIQHFRDEDEKKMLEEEEGEEPFVEEDIPEEIRVIAQALAYRGPEEGDLKHLLSLINTAYAPESNGRKDSFRSGDCISKDSLQSLLTGDEHRWLIVEAPGRTRGDGGSLILGAACYTTNGTSKKNGIVEGSLGSVRYFCVDPTFQRLYVGKRLLYRVEKAMQMEGCVRIMFSIPSPRGILGKWLDHQAYDHVGSTSYPAKYLGHQLDEGADVQLDMYAKSLTVSKPGAPVDYEAQGKDIGESRKKTEQPDQRNMHLPPHWRGVRARAAPSPPSAHAEAVSVEVSLDAMRIIENNSTNAQQDSCDDLIDIPDVD